MNRWSRESGIFERLEPCAGKLARTVLRGEWRSNALFLPGEWAKVAITFPDLFADDERRTARQIMVHVFGETA
jgi:hypothetical protein